jgi:hypothetical protein
MENNSPTRASEYRKIASELADANQSSEYQVFSEDTNITFYHASGLEVSKPRWDYARSVMSETEADLRDFGLGFYTCLDDEYPLKLASDREELVLNKYTSSLKGLRYIKFELDLEWLLSIGFHRRDLSSRKWCHPLRDRCRKWLSGCDVAIGVISNDKTYSAVEGFLDNLMPETAAIAMINAANYGVQYVFKSQEACQRLSEGFQSSTTFTQEQIHQLRKTFAYEKTEYSAIADTLRMDIMERGGGMFFERIITGGMFNGRVRF